MSPLEPVLVAKYHIGTRTTADAGHGRMLVIARRARRRGVRIWREEAPGLGT